MYEKIVIKYPKKKTMNFSIIIFLIIICIFFYRIIVVLDGTRERGGFSYVQLLNYTMPVVEEIAYNEEDYAENRASIRNICLEALGFYDINSFSIISSEISYFDGIIGNVTYVTDNNQYSSFVIDDNTVSFIETEDVMNSDLVKPLDNSKPEILIYHTHTSEGFNGVVNSSDNSINIVGAGEELKKNLEKYGFSVIHDTTDHSIQYNGCYNRSRETVQKYIDTYGEFKLIIDFHRDSIDNKDAVTININNEDTARFMFVTTKNSSLYSQNYELASEFTNISNSIFPNISRGIYQYNSGILAFNQDLNPNSVLIECGSYVNTYEEVENTTKYIARVIAEYFNKNE